MSDTVQQIKDRIGIVDVVSQYVKLERAGATLKARCPFHAERSPSFVVSPDRGTYHCFGCGVGGDIFSFVEAIEGIDFKGALKILADKAGVELVYEKGEKKEDATRLFEVMDAATLFYTTKLDEAALTYLKERGMESEIIKEFRLGFAGNAWDECSTYLKTKGFTDKEIVDAGMGKKNERGGMTDKFRNRIMFPIADSAGRVVAFSGRTFGPHASPEAPKYLNSPETLLYHKSRILYGFDRAKVHIRKHNCAILVEGQMDLLASHQAAWNNTVAVSGTAFTPEHAVLIHRMTENLVLALDADAAGIKAAGRAARAALQAGLNVKVARLPNGLDPADLILKEGKDAWSAAIRDSKDIITFLLDVLYEHAPEQDRFRRSVEAVVLPFLSDVQSPIAREQYIREIARRLSVSEAAVNAALANVPIAPQDPQSKVSSQPQQRQTSVPQQKNRAEEAFSIFLWQSSQKKPDIDIERFKTEFAEAAGALVLAELEQMPEDKKERLRFQAEELYGKSGSVSVEARTLLKVLHQERLAEELSRVQKALQHAEATGDEVRAAELTAAAKLLTSHIAKIHQAV